MSHGVIVFDFDGSIAYAPDGTKPAYGDPALGLARSAALPAGVRLMRRLESSGLELHIVTGRGQEHAGAIRYWLHLFLGHSIPVWCRPPDVALACSDQATWKAGVMSRLHARGAVGDNDRIDRVAARLANIHYLDARVLRAGIIPDFEPVAGWTIPGAPSALARDAPLPAWPDSSYFDPVGVA